jgi:hypothetical protein
MYAKKVILCQTGCLAGIWIQTPPVFTVPWPSSVFDYSIPASPRPDRYDIIQTSDDDLSPA